MLWSVNKIVSGEMRWDVVLPWCNDVHCSLVIRLDWRQWAHCTGCLKLNDLVNLDKTAGLLVTSQRGRRTAADWLTPWGAGCDWLVRWGAGGPHPPSLSPGPAGSVQFSVIKYSSLSVSLSSGESPSPPPHQYWSHMVGYEYWTGPTFPQIIWEPAPARRLI